MFLRIIIVAIFLAFRIVKGYTVNYYFHEKNGNEVNECMNAAIARLMSQTCLEFKENEHAHNSILFLQSRRCGFQDSNSTIHVDSNCVTADICTQFLQHAISGEKKHHSAAIRHLNLKFNCTEKCTRDCGVGGVVQGGCSCRCKYPFSGEHCESLKLAPQFTDPACGFVHGPSNGVISLKGEAEKDTFCQWVLKSDDPFHTFELEIEELDLDDQNVPPGQKCGDSLFVYGLNESIQNPIPCVADYSDSAEDEENTVTLDGSVSTLIGKKFHSKTNLLVIEYRGNRLPSRPHKGPIFKYATVYPQQYANAFPSLKYDHVVGSGANSLKSISFALFSTILLIFFAAISH